MLGHSPYYVLSHNILNFLSICIDKHHSQMLLHNYDPVSFSPNSDKVNNLSLMLVTLLSGASVFTKIGAFVHSSRSSRLNHMWLRSDNCCAINKQEMELACIDCRWLDIIVIDVSLKTIGVAVAVTMKITLSHKVLPYLGFRATALHAASTAGSSCLDRCYRFRQQMFVRM